MRSALSNAPGSLAAQVDLEAAQVAQIETRNVLMRAQRVIQEIEQQELALIRFSLN